MEKTFLLLVMIFALCSCDNSTNPSTIDSNEEPFICNVEGNQFTAKKDSKGTRFLSIQYLDSTLTGSNEPVYLLAITALDSNNTYISMICNQIREIGSPQELSHASYIPEGGTGYDLIQGTITLNKIVTGESISGTFSFTAREVRGDKVVNVTDGKFHSKYSRQ